MSVEDVFNMSSSEILGWKEYFSIYPTQGERLDWIINQLALLITKGLSKVKPQEFLPDYLKPSKEKSLEQQKQEARAFIAMYKGLEKK